MSVHSYLGVSDIPFALPSTRSVALQPMTVKQAQPAEDSFYYDPFPAGVVSLLA